MACSGCGEKNHNIRTCSKSTTTTAVAKVKGIPKPLLAAEEERSKTKGGTTHEVKDIILTSSRAEEIKPSKKAPIQKIKKSSSSKKSSVLKKNKPSKSAPLPSKAPKENSSTNNLASFLNGSRGVWYTDQYLVNIDNLNRMEARTKLSETIENLLNDIRKQVSIPYALSLSKLTFFFPIEIPWKFEQKFA